jgi:hypothetical protein
VERAINYAVLLAVVVAIVHDVRAGRAGGTPPGGEQEP